MSRYIENMHMDLDHVLACTWPTKAEIAKRWRMERRLDIEEAAIEAERERRSLAAIRALAAQFRPKGPAKSAKAQAKAQKAQTLAEAKRAQLDAQPATPEQTARLLARYQR